MPSHASDRVWRILALVGGGALVLVVLGLTVTYLADTSGEQQTLRGLTIDGHNAGHLTRPELQRVISRVDNGIAQREVHINLPDGSRTFLAAELGVSVDREALEEEAMAVGRRGGGWDRFRAWLGSFTSRRSVTPSLDFDRDRAAEIISALDGLVVAEPVEPRLTMSPEAELIATQGEDGTIVDDSAIVDRLGHQVAAGGPFDVDAPTRPLPPELRDEDVAAVAEELNELTASGIEVSVEDEVASIDAEALRLRLDLHNDEGRPDPVFDTPSLQGLIEAAFADVQLGGDDPVFEIVDDEPVVVEEGSPPLECCRDDAGEVVANAVLTAARGPVAVSPEPSDDPDLVAWAKGEGVVEKVAEFTTDHPCCQSRVNNIQRFADIVRGAYLLPGESLSLNEHVGERTSDRGFVPAGTIIRGHLVPTVGGGVSQFATTIFNAAFFAGFDFITYQSHSIYFSRYPYGREATISWPAPDLEFENTTDYPALIWTSYTDTSVTVSIYSTKSVEVEEVRQETSPARQCTRVDTFRKRTYEDGREVEDSVFATYRPSEGLDCNGNPTERPNL